MNSNHPLTPRPSRNRRLLQNHDTLAQWVQHGLNLVIVGFTLCFLAYAKDGMIVQQYRSMLVFAILIMTITYHLMGVFRRFDDLGGAIQHLARAWGIVVIILAWTGFLTKTSEAYSREVIVYWVFVSFMGQVLLITLSQIWFKLYRSKLQQRIPAIIIGSGDLASHLAHNIKKNIWLSDTIIGVINHTFEASTWKSTDIPLLGNNNDIEEIIKKHGVKRVYFALPLELTAETTKFHDRLCQLNIDLIWAPDIYRFQLLNHSVREVAGTPLINLNETPLMAGGPAFIKNLIDKSLALAAIILISPLLCTLAFAVKLSSPGPIIFKQRRDGWDGKKFNVYKFRSMHIHKAKEIIEQAKKGDTRVTPVGCFIRRTSLDELPQLFNVLNGSMSLVGPRPHAESHNVYYTNKVKAYLARHRIKPGITGLAQISGCRGETENIEDMEKRVKLDLEYICNWSLTLDAKILFLTPYRLLFNKGNAY